MSPLRLSLWMLQMSLLASCAGPLQQTRTVDLPLWEDPHQIQIQKIGVLTFTGSDAYGKAIEQHFSERLEESGYFDVVPISRTGQDLKPLDKNGSSSPLLEVARANNVDILVAGRMRTGYGRTNFGNAVIGAPVHKVVLSIKTINPFTGRIQSQKQLMREFKGEVGWHPESDASEANLFKRLGRECVDELVSQMFVSYNTVSVSLASPDRSLPTAWKGNRLALEGRWSAAQEQWSAAAKENPESSEIRYNLGLACEACQQYTEARRHYAVARDDLAANLYKQALARCNQAEAQYVAAVTQRQRFQGPVVRRLPPDSRYEQFSLRRLPVVR